ncbi:MAG: hypothetical protein F6J98_03725, partial [Moorea sp. SIO4G2]|nr:hypothetical protein [Moorena sp. SIO4G2]
GDRSVTFSWQLNPQYSTSNPYPPTASLFLNGTRRCFLLGIAEKPAQ